MLTESEREWAIKKSKWIKRDIYYLPEYDTKEELFDAAEFSERVAAKLARWDNEYYKDDHLCPYSDDDLDSNIPICHCTNFCKDHPKLGCIAAKLAWSRLQVEEEIDAD